MEAKDSVRAAVDEWIKRDQADNRTVGEVRRVMEREVMPAWGDRALASIRKRDVIELIDGIADRGAKIAANRALAYVRRFFNWCAGRDLIEANPAQFVEKPARRGPPRPRARRRRAGRGVARASRAWPSRSRPACGC